ncbi:hypothetical protein ASG92_16780 [Arthrobacter sp. Soil736]|nr:hypothetical protein ASG92_16780 [Arthrobacter sp. Soil736]
MSVRRDNGAVRQGLRCDVGAAGRHDDALPDVLPGGPDGQRVAIRFAGFVPAPLDARVLHLEEVREVSLGPKGNDALGRGRRVVLDRDLLQDSGTHLAESFDDQGAVRLPVCAGNTACKQGAIRFLRLRGQRLQLLPLTVRFHRDRMRVSSRTPRGAIPD